MNKIKRPAWVLFEQLHIDIHINTRMNVQDRNRLRKTLNSLQLKEGLKSLVLIEGPETEKQQLKVSITR